MIAAPKIPWFERWFARQVDARLRTQFAAVRIRGLDVVVEAARHGPLLIVSNHVAYWDSMLALAVVTRTLGLDGHALMEAGQLRRFAFLGRVGGFGVERDRPGDGERVVAHGAALLARPGRVVWVFPQGREVSAARRPLHFKRGAARMALKAREEGRPVHWLPVGLGYTYGAEPRATAWMSFGGVREVRSGDDPEVLAAAQASAVAAELSTLEDAAAAWVDGGRAPETFPMVLRGRRERLTGALSACLSFLTRRKPPEVWGGRR